MFEEKSSSWLRVLDVAFGVMAVIFSFGVLAYPDMAIFALTVMLSAALLTIGVARTVTGIFAKYLSFGLRAVDLGIGILSLVLASLAIVYPQFATQMLIYLLSFALILNGIARVAIGGFTDILPGWLRGLLVIVGMATVGLSLVVVLFPAWGILTLTFMLSLTLLLNGVARILKGLTGFK